MPATTLSPYEQDRNLRRQIAKQEEASRVLREQHRRAVEDTIGCHHKSRHLQGLVDEYDQDHNGFRERVQEDRMAWHRRLIFFAVVLLYIVCDLIVAGDVGTTLANQIAPYFPLDADSGEVPMWLRRLAGATFATLALVVTLSLKYISTVNNGRINAQLASLQPGEDNRFRRLRLASWRILLVEGLYLVLVAGMYFGFFGFAQQRAIIMESIAVDQKQGLEWNQNFKFEEGKVEAEAGNPQDQSSEDGVSLNSIVLAWPTAALYLLLWLLHFVLLALPTEGFGRELELAHFKRGKAEARVRKLDAQEGRLHRENLERIMSTAEGADREALIRITLPVAARMNEVFGRTVIEVPEATINPDEQGRQSSGQDAAVPAATAAGDQATAAAAPGNAEQGFYGEDPADPYEGIFGSRA